MTRWSKTGIVCAMVVVLGFAASVVHAGQAAIELKMGLVDPDTSVYVRGARQLAKEVLEATGGRVQIEVYSGAQLGSERDMYEGAQLGTIDICTAATSVISAFIPEANILDQLFLFDSVEQAHRVIDGKLGDLIVERARGQGVHILGWNEAGFRDTFANRPITKVEDFKGFKIRTMENRLQVAAFNALGAIATPMAAGEQFTALQQGTIDGNENAVANLLTNRWYEIIKHATNTKHLYVFLAFGLSDKAWRSIPEDIKPQFLEGVRKGIAYQRQLLLDVNAQAVEELKSYGVTFYEIDRDAMRAAVEPVQKEFRKNMNQEWLAVLNAELAGK